MTEMLPIKMSRMPNQSWGFRLQGGLDFSQPLAVQKVNVGGWAEKSGLLTGDVILKVNNQDVSILRHKDALDVITKAGDNFLLIINRYGIWKPDVTPLSEPTQTTNGDILLTKTSLAATPQEFRPIAGFNAKPAPFPKCTNLISEEKIAETLSSQAEVLAQGVIGVNFKKNEKSYDSTKSQVFKMLQESQTDGPDDNPEIDPSEASSTHKGLVSRSPITTAPTGDKVNVATPPSIINQPLRPVGVRSVAAPVAAPAPKAPAPSANPHCSECDRLIVGVFVRVKDKNLHVECFKCATCGTSLKNVGYYKINEKLYCDVHARQVVPAASRP